MRGIQPNIRSIIAVTYYSCLLALTDGLEMLRYGTSRVCIIVLLLLAVGMVYCLFSGLLIVHCYLVVGDMPLKTGDIQLKGIPEETGKRAG